MFGWNVWGSHLGVSTRREAIARDFDEIARLGFTVARWFVFCDGRSGIVYDDRGFPAGLDDRFFVDMDAALEIARHANVRLDVVLFDHHWLFKGVQHTLADPISAMYAPQSDEHSVDDLRNSLVLANPAVFGRPGTTSTTVAGRSFKSASHGLVGDQSLAGNGVTFAAGPPVTPALGRGAASRSDAFGKATLLSPLPELLRRYPEAEPLRDRYQLTLAPSQAA